MLTIEVLISLALKVADVDDAYWMQMLLLDCGEHNVLPAKRHGNHCNTGMATMRF